MPPWRCCSLYQARKTRQNSRASSMRPEPWPRRVPASSATGTLVIALLAGESRVVTSPSRWRSHVCHQVSRRPGRDQAATAPASRLGEGCDRLLPPHGCMSEAARVGQHPQSTRQREAWAEQRTRSLALDCRERVSWRDGPAFPGDRLHSGGRVHQNGGMGAPNRGSRRGGSAARGRKGRRIGLAWKMLCSPTESWHVNSIARFPRLSFPNSQRSRAMFQHSSQPSHQSVVPF